MMIRTTRAAVLLALAVLTVTGCRHEVQADLAASDVIATADGAEGRTTRALIYVNAGSKAACAEHGETIAKALGTSFKEPQFLGCVDRGLDTFGEYRVQIDLAQTDSADASGLYVGVTRRGDMVVAVLQITPGAHARIVAALPERLRAQITGQQTIAASVILRNDGDGALTYTIFGTFRDGVPVAGYSDFPLAPGGEVKLTLSDVSNAALALGAAPIVILRP